MSVHKPGRGGKPGNTRSAVSFVADGYHRAIALMAVTAFLGGVAEALFLITVTRSAFAITAGNDEVGIIAGWFLSVNQTLLVALAFVLVRVSMAGFATWQSARLSASAVARIRRRTARAFLESSWEVQQGQRTGSLQQVLSSYSGSASVLMNGLGGGALAIANLAAMLGLSIALDPLGAAFMLISVGLFGALLRPLRRRVQHRSRLQAKANMELATSVSEISQLGVELHVFNVQDEAHRRLSQTIDRVRDQARSVNFATGISSTLYVGMAYLALLAALAVVAASNATSLTSLGAVMLVMLRSLSYGQALQTSILTVSGAAPAIEALAERLEAFETGKRREGGVHVGHIGTTTVDNVSFAYAGDTNVLHELSFEIHENEIVGIIGPSGSGKSTLVQLLLGLRSPKQGKILADGRDISKFDRNEWARRLTFVPQASHLIDGTVAENVRFLRRDISDAEVERAARLAHLHDEIVEHPDGYSRSVGSLGGHLSGGQQQRLCIARALVEHPDVLILDEPTSALDARSENLIRTTLLGLKESMTIVVIAHRLTTLDICDRIMVVEGGRILGFDTPARLAEFNEFYRDAVALSGLR